MDQKRLVVKMGMTKCHGVTAIVIGVLELVLGGGLIIASFVFASYLNGSTEGVLKTPYWGGFPVSILITSLLY